MTVITVLGYGCVLCGFLYQAIKETAEERNWQVDVLYSKDEGLMTAYQIDSPPAILVDGKLVQMEYGGTKNTLEMLEKIIKTGIFPSIDDSRIKGGGSKVSGDMNLRGSTTAEAVSFAGRLLRFEKIASSEKRPPRKIITYSKTTIESNKENDDEYD